MTVKSLVTTGAISKATGIPLPTVMYIVHSRNIQPKSRAGRLRVFDSGVIEQVRTIHQAIRRV